MRILADSNIFIDFWKKPDQNLIDTFSKEDVVICGVVRCELLHGAKSPENMKKVSSILDDFEELNLNAKDWNKLGEMLFQLRTNGLTVPLSDAMIAYLAMKHKIPVWTRDNHFAYMQKVLPDLKIMQ